MSQVQTVVQGHPRTPEEAILIPGWVPPSAQELKLLGRHSAWTSTPTERANAMALRRHHPRDTYRGGRWFRLGELDPLGNVKERTQANAQAHLAELEQRRGLRRRFPQRKLRLAAEHAWLPGCRAP